MRRASQLSSSNSTCRNDGYDAGSSRKRLTHPRYTTGTTWTLPKLDGITHQEQSNAEVASWDISQVSPWAEQTLPPLALAYKHSTVDLKSNDCTSSLLQLFFFLRLPNGQYGPVSQLSRSEKCCTGPFNWSEAHCAGEKVKRKTGPFLRKSRRCSEAVSSMA